jgi:hypothetical protein
VLVIKVDAVGFQALQGFLNYLPDVFWLAAESAAIMTGTGILLIRNSGGPLN